MSEFTFECSHVDGSIVSPCVVSDWRTIKRGLDRCTMDNDFAILSDDTGRFVQAQLLGDDDWILEFRPGTVDSLMNCANEPLNRWMIQAAFHGFFTQPGWEEQFIWEAADLSSAPADAAVPILSDELVRSYLKRVRRLALLPDDEAAAALEKLFGEFATSLDD
jgi:hypothetical protein